MFFIFGHSPFLLATHKCVLSGLPAMRLLLATRERVSRIKQAQLIALSICFQLIRDVLLYCSRVVLSHCIYVIPSAPTNVCGRDIPLLQLSRLLSIGKGCILSLVSISSYLRRTPCACTSVKTRYDIYSSILYVLNYVCQYCVLSFYCPPNVYFFVTGRSRLYYTH